MRIAIDPTKSLEKLNVCFGGFSPTVMQSDIPKLSALEDAMAQRLAEHKAAMERANALEAARASEVRKLAAGETTWGYVVLDGTCVRIESCDTSAANLEIPGEIEGMQVVALGAECCMALESVQAISMPDSVISIGSFAFRDCANLRSIRFSRGLGEFSSGWVRNCHALESVRLPGKLEKITQAIFDIANLKSLRIGEGTYEVKPGAFAKSKLEEVAVDEANPFMEADGLALYSKGRDVLITLAVPCDSYSVAARCKAVAKKAFNSYEQLQEVKLPEELSVVGDFAYSRTSIRQFVAPQMLESIGERAFFGCHDLREVVLNDGIQHIGNNAFSETPVERLEIPHTIQELDSPIALDTPLTFSGKDATFKILEGEGQHLILDEHGALYRREPDGLYLVRMLEPEAKEYAILDGTIAIDEGAFATHPSIEKVVMPQSLKRIGKGAFKYAKNLAIADLPDGLEELGEEAFLDTSLQRLNVPAALTKIGSLALVTYGAHHGGKEPTLHQIEVSPENPRFYMSSGLLIERMHNFDRVVICTGAEPNVVVPESVTFIAPYAFSSVRTLDSLEISDNVKAVEIRGLAFDSMLSLVRVNLGEPIEGHDHFDFKFPKTARGAHQLRNAFGASNDVNVRTIFDHYDNAIVSRSGFDIATEAEQLSAYEQACLVLERLKDPVLISKTNLNLMESVMQKQLLEICIDTTRQDDKSLIADLFNLGYLNKENVPDVVEAINSMQDASMTNYILDENNRRFGAASIDFEL